MFVSVQSGTLGGPAVHPYALNLVVSDRVKNACQICALSSGWGYAAMLHSVTHRRDDDLFRELVSQVTPIAIRVTAGADNKAFALFVPTIFSSVVKLSNHASASSPNYPTGTVIVSNKFQEGFIELSPQEQQIVLMHLFRSPVAIKSNEGSDLLYHAALYAHAKCLPEFSTSGLMIKPENGKGYGVYFSAEKPLTLELGIAGKVIQQKDFHKLSRVHRGRVIHTCQCRAVDQCSHLMVFVDSACLPSHINSSLDSSNLQTINVPIESPNSNPEDVIECCRDKSGQLVVSECALFFLPCPLIMCLFARSFIRSFMLGYCFHFIVSISLRIVIYCSMLMRWWEVSAQQLCRHFALKHHETPEVPSYPLKLTSRHLPNRYSTKSSNNLAG